jgi:hypothetical protein
LIVRVFATTFCCFQVVPAAAILPPRAAIQQPGAEGAGAEAGAGRAGEAAGGAEPALPGIAVQEASRCQGPGAGKKEGPLSSDRDLSTMLLSECEAQSGHLPFRAAASALWAKPSCPNLTASERDCNTTSATLVFDHRAPADLSGPFPPGQAPLDPPSGKDPYLMFRGYLQRLEKADIGLLPTFAFLLQVNRLISYNNGCI